MQLPNLSNHRKSKNQVSCLGRVLREQSKFFEQREVALMAINSIYEKPSKDLSIEDKVAMAMFFSSELFHELGNTKHACNILDDCIAVIDRKLEPINTNFWEFVYEDDL